MPRRRFSHRGTESSAEQVRSYPDKPQPNDDRQDHRALNVHSQNRRSSSMPDVAFLPVCRITIPPRPALWCQPNVPVLQPAGQQAIGNFFGCQSEAAVVRPRAVDVQVPRTQALIPETELLHYPEAGPVLRPDIDL